ncbi:MAG: hypothetical protein KKG59_03555 [Nanoarchaeota archaeon]|nr:hypothetical protein [Nanoarchaeota archaeon]
MEEEFFFEDEEFIDDTDIYNGDEVERELEDNMISAWEAAFQRGYNEALD